MKRIEELTKSR